MPMKTWKNQAQKLLIIHNFFHLLPWAAHMAKNLKSIGNWSKAPSVLSNLWLVALVSEVLPTQLFLVGQLNIVMHDIIMSWIAFWRSILHLRVLPVRYEQDQARLAPWPLVFGTELGKNQCLVLGQLDQNILWLRFSANYQIYVLNFYPPKSCFRILISI